jgi:beta-galactosidase beta subunit
MPMPTFGTETLRMENGKSHQEVAQFIEGHVNRVANGRIRDLHVVYSDVQIVLQGRSRTYHAKQLAHQAVLDLTDGHPLLANQIVVV